MSVSSRTICRLSALTVAALATLSALSATATATGPSPISGGTPVQRGEYPWLVHVAGNMGGTWNVRCTGALITARHVLTAAHCTAKNPADAGYAYVDFGVANGLASRVQVTTTLRHPSARADATKADAAIWTLAQPVSVPHIPLVLGNDTKYYKTGTALILAGYGRTDGNGPAPQQAPVTVQATCRQDPIWFCAKTSSDTQGARPGDSGAPVFAKAGTQYVLVGVTGSHSGTKHWFTRLATPLVNEWIRKTAVP